MMGKEKQCASEQRWKELNISENDRIDVSEYQNLCRRDRWKEFRDGAVKEINGVIWTDAIQTALEKHKHVWIPFQENEIYIDAPLILDSGNSLSVHPKTKICLKPGVNTCMLRNRHMEGGKRDDRISVSGGIWTTLTIRLFDGENNGNIRGNSSSVQPVPGSHGALLFKNAEKISIQNLTIRECAAFGIQLNDCNDFHIHDIIFERQKRDGIHIGGNVCRGEIDHIHGKTDDDFIALNAWDWCDYIMSYGPIEQIYIHDIFSMSGQIRFLPGRKQETDCSIRCIFLENIEGIDNIKMYGQPNLESYALRGEIDRSNGLGTINDVHIRKMRVNEPKIYPGLGFIEICSQVKNLHLEDVDISCSETDFHMNDYSLIRVGPKSATMKLDEKDPQKWLELFEPNAICLAENIVVEEVCFNGKEFADASDILKISRLSPNKEYPNSTPEGGYGYGIIRNCRVRKNKSDNVLEEVKMDDSVKRGLVPFWNSDVMYEESTLPVKMAGKIKGRLRFCPLEIISVENLASGICYEENKDFHVEGHELIFHSQEKPLEYLEKQMLHGKDLPKEIADHPKLVGVIDCLYTDSPYIVARQLAVTYRYDTKELQYKIPQYNSARIKRSLQKLRAQKNLNILLYGDSICTGCNSSGCMKIPPYLPSWYDMVCATLQERYNATVHFKNISEAGRTATWAVDQIPERLRGQQADLMIIAFGMNDASMKLDKDQFVENIAKIRAAQENPDCEYILIGSIIPNPDSNLTGDHRGFVKALEVLEDDRTTLVDVGALQIEMLKNKVYSDMSGNNINHPNDYLARMYAISVLQVFETER